MLPKSHIQLAYYLSKQISKKPLQFTTNKQPQIQCYLKLLHTAMHLLLQLFCTQFIQILIFYSNFLKIILVRESKKLPESNVDSTVGFAHGRAKVPDTFSRGQEWNRKYYTCSNEIYDAQVLNQQEVGRSHLQLTHPVGDKTNIF